MCIEKMIKHRSAIRRRQYKVSHDAVWMSWVENVENALCNGWSARSVRAPRSVHLFVQGDKPASRARPFVLSPSELHAACCNAACTFKQLCVHIKLSIVSNSNSLLWVRCKAISLIPLSVDKQDQSLSHYLSRVARCKIARGHWDHLSAKKRVQLDNHYVCSCNLHFVDNLAILLN
jgi:hypothetical protein